MQGMWNWRAAARCRTEDAENLFVMGARQREARVFCRPCPVRTECLAHALDHRVEFGVWGGMTERERRALLRLRPAVESWAGLLTEARERFYGGPDASDELGGPGGLDEGARLGETA
ncbi:MAG TPA: WhiB family transcriptional regulator [Pseudonocardia sp.]|nr:WhiB family transcriptional regulator [Pseudonocardia sp.]